MNDRVRVGIAQMCTAKEPAVLSALGLGSCLGIVVYDPQTRIGGLAHTLLPAPRPKDTVTRPAKFVTTAIEALVEALLEAGAERTQLQAKIMGGANMFLSLQANGDEGVGGRNASMARQVLQELAIPLVAEDVGGHHGRTIDFHLATGTVQVRSLRGGCKEITL